MTAYLDGIKPPTTVPPPAPEAKALRAIGVELDTIGEALTRLAANTETIAEMGEDDSKTLGRVERKLDVALDFLRDFAGRIQSLEQWRGDHVREHARQ